MEQVKIERLGKYTSEFNHEISLLDFLGVSSDLAEQLAYEYWRGLITLDEYLDRLPSGTLTAVEMVMSRKKGRLTIDTSR